MEHASVNQDPINRDLVFINKKTPVTTSKIIADTFGKAHKNVIRDIENLECSERFRRLNFELSYYTSDSGQKRRYKQYLLTRNGCVRIIFGFNGKKAAEFQERYIEEFRPTESPIKPYFALLKIWNARLDFGG